MSQKKIVLSGAITGHLEEAEEYFFEAKKAAFKRFPTAQVFDPMTLPKGISWDDAMTICKTRIRNWATDMVIIENQHYKESRGSCIELEEAKERGLVLHTFAGGLLLENKAP